MVLGLRSKSRKGPSVNVDYLVHLQEIKPWPPSNSLKSARSVLLQWENGDRNSGSTSSVVPSLGSGVGDGKIEFNESFKITVTLSRELSVKGGNADTFQKNCLELNLYELRSNKAVKGQILGTVVVDLAEYGILKETKTISAPVNCKRSFRNTAQPVLLIKIEPYQKRNSRSLSMESLSKGTSLDKDGKETVSESMNGDYDDETEIAAFTDDDDDDASQHSSLTVSSSAFEATEGSPQSEENAFETVEDSPGRDKHVSDLSLKQEAARTDVTPVTATQIHVTRSSSHSSSVDSSSEVVNLENNSPSLSDLPEKNLISDTIPATQSVLSSSSIAYGEEEVICNNSSQIFDHKNMEVEIHEKITDGRSIIKQDAQLPVEERKTSELEASASPGIDTSVDDKPGLATSVESDFQEVDAKIDRGQSRVVTDEALKINDSHAGLKEVRDGKELENGQREETEGQQCQPTELEASYNFSPDNTRRPVESVGDAIHSRRDPEIKNDSLPSTKLKHVKSVRSLLDSARSKKLESNNQFTAESGETNSLQHAHRSDENLLQNRREDTMSLSRETKNNLSDSKLQQLEQRIEGLERELREAAALEVALYSVVAEHGSSANKVHAPARRLSRLYLHAWKHSKSRRATAARSAVSGLVLVAKACGNDVPRLTFWLSNSVVLRAIISAALGDSQLPVSAGPHNETNDGAKGNEKTSSLLKWQESSIRKNQSKFGLAGSGDEWEETQTFTTTLENIEAWIFSRIIESVWWQTLTPHMQSSSKASETIITSNLRNSYGRRPSLSDQEQANFSMELWNKAFKDACERLCPVRAAGHECGCLPVLAKLVMEQCVSRLDVAMFNAILRESADDIPTDPVSDPISDSKVLPIPAGKSSFGAGAQLKNAIGNWSRWLTDLFDLDEDDSHEVLNDLDEDDIQEGDTSSKSFHLLNALSDLMMLPKDMLLDRSIRKEVCPTFDAPLIKRILSDFSPDEFCPDPIPEEVFQALDEEDLLHDEEESFTNFPSKAAPVIYSPPSAALLASFIGEPGKESQLRRSSSSVLRKSYTSDDELDELDSPLASITSSFRSTSTPSWKAKENGVRKVLRYELLQEVWREGD